MPILHDQGPIWTNGYLIDGENPLFLSISYWDPKTLGEAYYGWFSALQCQGTDGNLYKPTKEFAELWASIGAATPFKWTSQRPMTAAIVTRSKYVVDGISALKSWKTNGWKNTDGTCIEYMELWKLLDTNLDKAASSGLNITFSRLDSESNPSPTSLTRWYTDLEIKPASQIHDNPDSVIVAIKMVEHNTTTMEVQPIGDHLKTDALKANLAIDIMDRAERISNFLSRLEQRKRTGGE